MGVVAHIGHTSVCGCYKPIAHVQSAASSRYSARMTLATIDEFHAVQSPDDRAICDALRSAIDLGLPDAESKIWHGHPVWFLNGNPIVGYSKLKDCVRLMFWSGADFDEQGLMPGTGKFKDASIRYSDAGQVNEGDLRRWLGKSRTIQWDYKNVQKRKGRLERLV